MSLNIWLLIGKTESICRVTVGFFGFHLKVVGQFEAKPSICCLLSG